MLVFILTVFAIIATISLNCQLYNGSYNKKYLKLIMIYVIIMWIGLLSLYIHW